MNILCWVLIGSAFLFLILLLVLCSSSRRTAKATGSSSPVATSWIPDNLLEEKLKSFRDQEISRSAFINGLVASEVFILTAADGKTAPGDCDSISRAERTRLIPVYTSLHRLKKNLKLTDGNHAHIQRVKMRTWIASLTKEYGLIVNPDHESSVEISPDDVQQLRFEEG